MLLLGIGILIQQMLSVLVAPVHFLYLNFHMDIYILSHLKKKSSFGQFYLHAQPLWGIF